MKAELVKRKDRWDLYLIADGSKIASTLPNPMNKLSLKNCQAIELCGVQQTKWDVEIEMICPHPEDTYVCGMQYGCDEDGCNHPNQVPYLDTNGCLILKK